MFGYVRPSVGKLTEQEQAAYRALYCGLCHTLGQRCGEVSRLILNYDFAFLAALLSAGTETRLRRCVSSPIRPRAAVVPDEALAMAADCSVILAWHKLEDQAADDGLLARGAARTAQAVLYSAYQKASVRLPSFTSATIRELDKLRRLEQERCPTLDEPADTFAALLAGIAQEMPEGTQRRIFSQLFYHLGRWIYLVDAADDLKKDAKNGSYNPILLRFSLTDGAWTEEARKAVAGTLDASIRRMAAASELWDFGPWAPLVRATVYEGLYCVGGAVLEGTFHAAGRKAGFGKKEHI